MRDNKKIQKETYPFLYTDGGALGGGIAFEIFDKILLIFPFLGFFTVEMGKFPFGFFYCHALNC
jgi:hypothetical protein